MPKNKKTLNTLCFLTLFICGWLPIIKVDTFWFNEEISFVDFFNILNSLKFEDIMEHIGLVIFAISIYIILVIVVLGLILGFLSQAQTLYNYTIVSMNVLLFLFITFYLFIIIVGLESLDIGFKETLWGLSGIFNFMFALVIIVLAYLNKHFAIEGLRVLKREQNIENSEDEVKMKEAINSILSEIQATKSQKNNVDTSTSQDLTILDKQQTHVQSQDKTSKEEQALNLTAHEDKINPQQHANNFDLEKVIVTIQTSIEKAITYIKKAIDDAQVMEKVKKYKEQFYQFIEKKIDDFTAKK